MTRRPLRDDGGDPCDAEEPKRAVRSADAPIVTACVTLSTQRLFGCDFVSDATMDQVADVIIREARTAGRGWRCVVTPNVDHLVQYERSASFAEVARQAFLCLPDGMPIVWVSRLVHRPLRTRLAGSDLFATLWPRLAADAIPTVVFASTPDLAGRLATEHRALRAVIPPFFQPDDDAAVTAVIDDIADAVRETDAKVLIIGISFQKGHVLAARLTERWGRSIDTPVVLLLGASADFYVGLDKRAPAWMQRSGLEWMHRLMRDPRRMAKRYLVDDSRFAVLSWREWRSIRGSISRSERASSDADGSSRRPSSSTG